MKFISVILFLTVVHFAKAQSNISGVINSYTPVTAISGGTCNTQITVQSAAAFNVGDTVLLIQMKGAVIDTTNSAGFGNILNLDNAGNYEFSHISSISGSVISLAGSLTNTYTIEGIVQLIKVPCYASANVTGTLTAQPWNGTTGGVLAFFVANTLTLNANIDVTGRGFIGGNISRNPDGGCGAGSPDYYYNIYQPIGPWQNGGAMKGEGIAVLDTPKLAGKGKLANGGGGGNKHNHGGGGGSNFTQGGQGGESLAGCPINGNMGIGGLSLAGYIQTDKLYLGGGGGCGDYNNSVGSNGANGGGIVIIKAGNIVGNGDSIKANGADETVIGTGIADGVGGGGGGGLIFLDVPGYSGNLILAANGGQGGDQDPYYGCVGTGGGGGTGAVLTSQASLPANITVITNPGRAGMFLSSDASVCSGNYYATAGIPNTNGPITGITLIEDNYSSMVVHLGNDTTLCNGNTLLLNAGISNATYVWQDGSTAPTFLVSDSGLYWVAVTNGLCTGRDSIHVAYNSLSFQLVNDSSCTGDTLVITPAFVNATYLWQDGSTTSSYVANNSGLYWVKVHSGPCSVADSIMVTPHMVDIRLGNDTSLCAGDSLLLDPNIANATSYLWQDGSTQQFYVVKNTGSYRVQVSNGICTATDSIAITFSSLTFSLINDSGCLADTLVITPPVQNATYLWQDGSTAPTFRATTDGVFRVTVNNHICIKTDSILVNTHPVFVNLGIDTNICTGDSLLLNPQVAGVNYLWQNGNTQGAYLVKSPGLYWVQVSNGNCTAGDSIVVSFSPLPVNLGSDTTLCTGNTLVLSTGYNNATYQWQDGSTQPTYTVTATGLYWVQVNTATCWGHDSVQVTFNPLPVVNLGPDTTLCVGNTVVLNAFNSGATYLWNDGSTLPDKTVSFSGNYLVAVGLNGCIVADSILVTFNSPPPRSGFPSDTSICIGETLLLNAACGGCSYNWQNNSHDSIFVVNTEGNYFVTISNNCGQSAYNISVNTINCNCIMFIPNVFTPNGDGVNDVFIPEYNCGLVFYHLMIFDRWGEKVFETFSPTTTWDGSFKNHPCPGAVYVYYLEYTATAGIASSATFHKKGGVTLLR